MRAAWRVAAAGGGPGAGPNWTTLPDACWLCGTRWPRRSGRRVTVGWRRMRRGARRSGGRARSTATCCPPRPAGPGAAGPAVVGRGRVAGLTSTATSRRQCWSPTRPARSYDCARDTGPMPGSVLWRHGGAGARHAADPRSAVQFERLDGDQAAAILDVLYCEVYAEPPYEWGDEHAALFQERFAVQRRAGCLAATSQHTTGRRVRAPVAVRGYWWRG
jgi:hypothetical protein